MPRPEKEKQQVKKVVIFGNKSEARETYYCLKHFSDYNIVGFTVDRDFIDSDRLFQLPVIPFDDLEKTFSPQSHHMKIAVGYVQNNRIRKERYFSAKEMGYHLINFISPKSVSFPESLTGDNCLIHHFTVVSPDARIGNNVLIGSHCSIGHDVVIGDHCFLSNGVSIAGGVTIGSGCFISTNATIRNKVSIGKECVIGAGAIILENVGDKSVCLGEPATILPISSDELPLG
jgi:sugar O-acyltransferase (sialic acid O-acetyltransferase NeuD family)